jgi:hypothetical protein
MTHSSSHVRLLGGGGGQYVWDSQGLKRKSLFYEVEIRFIEKITSYKPLQFCWLVSGYESLFPHAEWHSKTEKNLN